MAHVSYIGRNGGGNAELEAAKTEALQLQNELTRVKLLKLQGGLVEKRQVVFLLGNSLTVLRGRLLALPAQLAARLKGHLDPNSLHTVKMDLEDRVHRFLLDLIRDLERAADPEAAIRELTAEDDGGVVGENDEVARELKHEAALARRREKRQAKAARTDRNPG